MSLGLGIFLSAVIVTILVFYHWTRDRWNWGRGVRRITLWLIVICFILGLSIWDYEYFKNRPTKQNAYYGLSLGMTKDNVAYVKGKPTHVMTSVEKNGWIKMIDVNDIEKGKNFKDYYIWTYEMSKSEVLNIVFDIRGVTEIGCYSQGCLSILGISTGSTEDDVISRFGNPDREKTEGLIKKMIYKNLNITMYLEQKKVYYLAVGINE